MIRFLIVDVLLPLFVFWLVQALLKSLFSGFRSAVTPTSKEVPRRPAPPVQTGGELKKDPVCGTYVSVDASITKKVNGELLHFCSTSCRDKYRAA